MRNPRPLFVALAALLLLSCDAVNGAVSGLTEGRWQVVDANGAKGELHLVMNATDLRIGLPEHVRVERIETRSVKKDDGTTQEEKRERALRVVSGSCEEAYLCEVTVDPGDSHAIVIKPKSFGDTTLHVSVMLDEKDEVHDKLHVRVIP